MGQRLRDRLHSWGRHKVVLVLRDVLSNLNRVLTNGAKRRRHFFSAVTTHGITSNLGSSALSRQTAFFDAATRSAVTPARSVPAEAHRTTRKLALTLKLRET